jgi:hypothetical protein
LHISKAAFLIAAAFVAVAIFIMQTFEAIPPEAGGERPELQTRYFLECFAFCFSLSAYRSVGIIL